MQNTYANGTRQLNLFDHVAGAYAQLESGRLSNQDLYRMAAGRAGVDASMLKRKDPVGRTGQEHNLLKRTIRWHQQTLRRLGILEKVEGTRGVWELTEAGKSKLRKIRDGVAILGFSTNLGVAIWSNCNRVFERLDEPIFLALTSPPYPLAKSRAYGNPSIENYIDFICHTIEPIVRNLAPGGNVVLNLGDVFERGSPAKSTYIEELTISLKKRFGLHLMNRIIWQSNKPPGPIQWASINRMQIHEAYETCLWLTNSPKECVADNRRVLEPHTDSHKKLIAKGGEQREAVNSDGAHQIKRGAYGKATAGRIPRNIFQISHTCQSQRDYKRRAKELGLQPHGAPMPLALARKLVRFLTDVGQLVVDLFAGSQTTPLACELEGRPWISTENVYDYVRGGAERLKDFPGFELAEGELWDLESEQNLHFLPREACMAQT